MNLGFYYHIPLCSSAGKLRTASYLGCFLDELANHVDSLTLFMHESETDDNNMDYELTAKNICYVSLGRKPRPEIRAFLGGKLVAPVREDIGRCDVMLVRAPTHLFAAWVHLCKKAGTKLVPLLVGDYRAGNAFLKFPFPKKQIIQFLNWYVDCREQTCLRGQLVLANSRVLVEKYRPIARAVYEVRTTTLSEASFYEREDTCTGDTINLLYTGRFEWQKGLQELFDAFAGLVHEHGVNAILHFAGWQGGHGTSIQASLLQQAASKGVGGRVIFHGKKKVGRELDALYRLADIYVMPSHAEGFPRTLWEAMANSCPVVATSVGSIPDFLCAGQHALLVPPKDTQALQGAIMNIIGNKALRQRLISEGQDLAREDTLQTQAIKLINLLESA